MSIFYKLDTRTKLFFILLLTLLVFLVDKLPVAVCLVITFFVIRFTAKIPFHALKMIKNLTLLASVVILMQTIFGPGETYILKPLIPPSFPVLGGMGALKWEGFNLGLVIVCRLAALFILLPIFTETTPPSQISTGLCSLGFNYRSAFIITTAFNLIPFFRKEALIIMDAQKLRGVRTLGLKAYAGLLFPLLLGAMRKAQISSVAMDSRAFGIYNKRTWSEKPKMKTYDFLFMAACVVFFIIIKGW